MPTRRRIIVSAMFAASAVFSGCVADRPPVARTEPSPSAPATTEPATVLPSATVEDYARGLANDLASALARTPAFRDARFNWEIIIGPAQLDPGVTIYRANHLAGLLAKHLGEDPAIARVAQVSIVDQYPAKPAAPPADANLLRSPGGEDPPPGAAAPVDQLLIYLRVSPGQPNIVHVQVVRGRGNETVLSRKYAW